MIKLTKEEINEIVSMANQGMKISENDLDEMAIPTYLHHNPLIQWLFWKRLESIVALSKLIEIRSVLDFGCGLGVLLPTLKQQVKEVHATDLYPHFAKALCKRRGIEVNFHESHNISNSLVDSSLDLVIAADSMEHLEDPGEYLQLFRNKLKVNGRLIISGPTENFVYRLGRVLAGYGDKGDYHHTNVDMLKTIIQESGFCLENERCLPFAVPPYLFKVLEFKKA